MSRPRRAARAAGRALLGLVGAYLVGRALIEPLVIDPTRSSTYRNDWGGPHYLGVLLVHCGPGLLVAALAVRRFRHHRQDTRLARGAALQSGNTGAAHFRS